MTLIKIPLSPTPTKKLNDVRFFCFFFLHAPLTRSSDFTMAQLRLELLKEEAKRTPASPPSAEDTQSQKPSPSVFFQKAIEIEDRL